MAAVESRIDPATSGERVTAAEVGALARARRPTPGWRSALRQRNLLLGGAIVLAIGAVAIFAPVIAPYDPQATNYDARQVAPGWDYPFGTDNLGKDILSRVIHGARIDLQVGILSVISPLIVGVLLGAASGYWGGKIDSAVMRLVDVVQAFPFLILVIAIVAVLGPGLHNLYIAVALVAWVSYARIIRGEILVVKQKEFVEAARSMGMSDARVVARHVLPNAIAPALVFAMADIVLYIVLAASLSYLGLGARPPEPEWGAMITEGRTYLATAWWMSFFPGLAIVVTGIGFSLLGDGLADALRPTRR